MILLSILTNKVKYILTLFLLILNVLQKTKNFANLIKY